MAGRSKSGKFKPHLHIAESTSIRKSLRHTGQRLRLKPTKRKLHKQRKVRMRRILTIKIKLLEVDRSGNTNRRSHPGPRRPRIISVRAGKKRIASALSIKK